MCKIGTVLIACNQYIQISERWVKFASRQTCVGLIGQEAVGSQPIAQTCLPSD